MMMKTYQETQQFLISFAEKAEEYGKVMDLRHQKIKASLKQKAARKAGDSGVAGLTPEQIRDSFLKAEKNVMQDYVKEIIGAWTTLKLGEFPKDAIDMFVKIQVDALSAKFDEKFSVFSDASPLLKFEKYSRLLAKLRVDSVTGEDIKNPWQHYDDIEQDVAPLDPDESCELVMLYIFREFATDFYFANAWSEYSVPSESQPKPAVKAAKPGPKPASEPESSADPEPKAAVKLTKHERRAVQITARKRRATKAPQVPAPDSQVPAPGPQVPAPAPHN